MRWRKSAIDGTFGDKTVLLTTGVIDRPRKAVLLFHGVHSSSSSDPGNKYAHIGAALAENGVMPILCETSRRVRNRHDYANKPIEWIFDAFRGKTYLHELEDCYRAYVAVKVGLFPQRSERAAHRRRRRVRHWKSGRARRAHPLRFGRQSLR